MTRISLIFQNNSAKVFVSFAPTQNHENNSRINYSCHLLFGGYLHLSQSWKNKHQTLGEASFSDFIIGAFDGVHALFFDVRQRAVIRPIFDEFIGWHHVFAFCREAVYGNHIIV
jgi:hypothetical protein